MSRRTGPLSPLLKLVTIVLTTAVGGACRMTAQDLEPMERLITLLPQAYEKARADRAQAGRQAAEVAEIAAAVPSEFAAFVRYHEARLLAISGDQAAAQRLLDALAQQPAPLPEALALKMQLIAAAAPGGETDQTVPIEVLLGELLPLSGWGRQLDAMLEQRETERVGGAFRDVRREVIPLPDTGKLLRIAQLYEDMHQYDRAGRAYLEAIYSGFGPPEFPEFGRETWISEQAAEPWMSAARCEAAAGRRDWAGHALLMAVAPSAKRELRAKELLREAIGGKQTLPQPRPDLDVLLRIVDLYCECRMHPRALLVLDEAARLPKADVAERRRAIREEWAGLVASYANAREQTCFLFGRKVADVADPVELQPREFPYAAP